MRPVVSCVSDAQDDDRAASEIRLRLLVFFLKPWRARTDGNTFRVAVRISYSLASLTSRSRAVTGAPQFVFRRIGGDASTSGAGTAAGPNNPGTAKQPDAVQKGVNKQ